MKKIIITLCILISHFYCYAKKIIVPHWFEPSITLSDSIKNSTLEDIITRDIRKDLDQDIPNHTPLFMALEREDRISFKRRDVEKIASSSNLVKAFYLQNKDRFIDYNLDYYVSLWKKVDKTINKEKSKKNWDKYL